MANKRVAVVVRDGNVIGNAHDEGVDVIVFDWDEYNELSPADTEGAALPYEWRDLARVAEVPFAPPSAEQYEELISFVKLVAAQGTPSTAGLSAADILSRARQLVEAGL